MVKFSVGSVVASLSAFGYALPESAMPRAASEARSYEDNPQVAIIDPKSFNVLAPNGGNASFRADQSVLWDPTNTSAPFFQVFDAEFYDILGDDPWIHEVSSDPSFAFAHEAPVWVPETDEIWFSSNAGGRLGRSDLNNNNQIAKISVKDVEAAMGGTPQDVNVSHPNVPLPDFVQMTNGATGPYFGNILVMNQGRGGLPANIALVNPQEPYNATVILDNFYGRQFNSLNDAKIHHPSGNIFFADVPYGFYQNFKPAPGLPNQVYAFDPSTGSVRVVADQLSKPNGLAFSPDYKIAYIADTGLYGGLFPNNQTLPATVYAYDVTDDLFFVNRRVFAYADTGASDGLNVDNNGYVYGGCGDGVHVWNPKGKLVGKFFTGASSANFAWAGKGKLFILQETKIFLASIASEGMNLVYH
ncbi:D-lactonohydrolase-like protein [Cylindrobasidium torrendii FP15055 ss-10]|uniref:D-lactonohydrolase-like protein n=1 Tax=Cylindrobasidium torrendii FP15055 ss-10 TaxID=1314674 RepID=A0A0D7BCV3_9AGAR|nr:D-lactonohydrolase-like protein [Cylindrobasidium torrendii FP15055 ss-10]